MKRLITALVLLFGIVLLSGCTNTKPYAGVDIGKERTETLLKLDKDIAAFKKSFKAYTLDETKVGKAKRDLKVVRNDALKIMDGKQTSLINSSYRLLNEGMVSDMSWSASTGSSAHVYANVFDQIYMQALHQTLNTGTPKLSAAQKNKVTAAFEKKASILSIAEAK